MRSKTKDLKKFRCPNSNLLRPFLYLHWHWHMVERILSKKRTMLAKNFSTWYLNIVLYQLGSKNNLPGAPAGALFSRKKPTNILELLMNEVTSNQKYSWHGTQFALQCQRFVTNKKIANAFRPNFYSNQIILLFSLARFHQCFFFLI